MDLKDNSKIILCTGLGLLLWSSTPLSTPFQLYRGGQIYCGSQLYRGGQFYWWYVSVTFLGLYFTYPLSV
jgi:hypothetical protein